MKLAGTFTALVTPFFDDADQGIDWAAFDALIDQQIEGGITGLVPCGTTGESPALSHDEHAAVVARTIARAKGRALVIAGTGSNATRVAVHTAETRRGTHTDTHTHTPHTHTHTLRQRPL